MAARANGDFQEHPDMTVEIIKMNGRSICGRVWSALRRVVSDGDGGPEDGVNHLHPEHVFNVDLHSRGAVGVRLFR